MSFIKRLFGDSSPQEVSVKDAMQQLLHAAEDGLEKPGDHKVKISGDFITVEVSSGLLASGKDVEAKQAQFVAALKEADVKFDRNIIHTDVVATGVTRGETNIPIKQNGGLDAVIQKLNQHLRHEEPSHGSHAEQEMSRRAQKADQQMQR